MADRKVRVHNLAKELMVNSKTIIEKCRAEGIDVKNHMHVVGPGLEATIREWFSEGSHATAVEEANRVNLDAVRVKPKRQKKTTDAPTTDDGDVPVLEEPHAESTDTTQAPPATIEAAPVESAPAAPDDDEPIIEVEVIEENELEQIVPAVAAEAPQVEPPPATPETKKPAADAQPPKPSPQKNIPAPAKLSGPRLVRMERPDVIDRPRPAPRPAARGPMGPSVPPLPGSDEERRERERGGVRGRAVAKGAEPAGEGRIHPRRGVLRDVREDVNEKLREWRDRDLIERKDRLAHASGRGIGGLRAIEGKQSARRGGGSSARTTHTAPKKDHVELEEPIVIKELSREAGIPSGEIIKKLMAEHEQLARITDVIDTEIARAICAENGIELTVIKARSPLDRVKDEFDALPRTHVKTRPPVVTVLGHVDHGKTSLLDRIRKAKVAAGEAGGITQHIGAYRAKVGDKFVTFLDTPGHAAFTAMRARGAHLTDVVVLVVAADDGIMPTTLEAIAHAKAANTTIVVALNKIDLPHDINKIYGQLAENGLTPSGDWGGHTDVIKTSATTGQGIDELLTHLATLSDVLDLRADTAIPATGTIVEAHRDESLGNVAHVLVQEGVLKPGDVFVCGASYGRVRNLRDEHGRGLKEAGPSTPVEVTGLSEVPEAGDRFYVLDTPQRAKEIAEAEAARRREQALIRTSKPTNLESMLANAADGEIPELPIILRADVQGSVDVLKNALSEFPATQVRLDVIHAGVGNVTESDVVLAKASSAIIIAFSIVPDNAVQKLADGMGVDIRSYRVIYNVLDDIRKALEGLLAPEEKLESRGRAEVREIFHISRVGKIAGCFIRDGLINRNHQVRVVRDGVIVKDLSPIDSLRRFKDDVKEVKAGFECGIRISGFDDLKPADVIESVEVIKIARKLE